MPVKTGLSSMSAERLAPRPHWKSCWPVVVRFASSCCTLAVSCWDGEAPWEVCVSQNTRSVQSEAGAGTWAEISSDGRQQLQHLWCKTKGQQPGSCTANAELTTFIQLPEFCLHELTSQKGQAHNEVRIFWLHLRLLWATAAYLSLDVALTTWAAPESKKLTNLWVNLNCRRKHQRFKKKPSEASSEIELFSHKTCNITSLVLQLRWTEPQTQSSGVLFTVLVYKDVSLRLKNDGEWTSSYVSLEMWKVEQGSSFDGFQCREPLKCQAIKKKPPSNKIIPRNNKSIY